MNTNLKPEDFWPDAEKLLDNHYKAKRRRKTILWTFSALLIVGALVYLASDKRNNVVSEYNYEQKSISDKNKSIVKNNPVKSNATNENQIQNNEPINIKSQNSVTTGTPAKQNNPLAEIKINSGTELNSGTTARGNKNKSENLNFSPPFENLIANQNNNKQMLSKKIQPSVKENNSAALTESQVIQESFSVSENTSQKPEQESELTDIKLTDHGMKSDMMNARSIHSKTFSKFEVSNSRDHIYPVRENEVKEPHSKHPAEYRLEILAGANQITKSLSGFESRMVENRRNSWETDVITPQLMIAVARTTEHYSIALGLNYIEYGEKVDYDPTVKNKFPVDNSYWNTFTTTVVDTDTNFVYGFVYFSQQTFQQLDSNYIQQIDSVEQIVINNNIVKSTGTNIISYVEMPLTLSYYFGKQKFRYGLTAGISAGMLVYSNGYYLNNKGNDVININDAAIFRKMIWNGQIGLELKYCLTPALNFHLRPRYQMNLNSIVKDDAGFKQKYSAFGISAGLSVLLK